MEKSIYSQEYELFLQVLRETRQEKGLTQIEIADRLGETQSFVSKVERGNQLFFEFMRILADKRPKQFTPRTLCLRVLTTQRNL